MGNENMTEAFLYSKFVWLPWSLSSGKSKDKRDRAIRVFPQLLACDAGNP